MVLFEGGRVMVCFCVLCVYVNFDIICMFLLKLLCCCFFFLIVFVCGRVLELDRIFRFVMLVLGVRSSVRVGLKWSLGGVVGSWDFFVFFKLDVVWLKVFVGDKYFVSSGVCYVFGIGRSCVEYGEMGLILVVVVNGGVEIVVKFCCYVVLIIGVIVYLFELLDL